MRNAIALLIVALALLAAISEKPPIRLAVNPHVLLPGGMVSVEALILPRAANRLLRLDAEPELAVSEFSLEGDKSPIRYSRKWIAGASGTYLIRATVYDGRRNILAQATTQIVVADE